MTVRPVLNWQSPDSTQLLNSRSLGIIDRAVFDGGAVTLSPTAMSLTIQPFVAHGIDGLVVISDAVENMAIPGNSTGSPVIYHIVCHARWRSMADAICNLLLITDATYNTSVERPHFISFGKLTVPNGATTGTGCTLDLSTSDLAIGAMGKSPFKGTVATLGDLPAGTATAPLRLGDAYVVRSENQIYIWTATGWQPTGTQQRVHMAVAEHSQRSMRRHTLRSGLVATSMGNETFDYDGVGTPFIEQPATANRLGLRAMRMLVHGHYLETEAQLVTMPAPPGAAPDRYDLVYIEVWREEVDPATVTTFPTYPVGSTVTGAELEDLGEAANLAADTALVAGGSAASRTLEVSPRDPNTFVEVMYRIGVLENCPRSWLTEYMTSDPAFFVPSGDCPPVPGGDGVYVQGVLQPEISDRFTFISTPSAGTFDDSRWMIPLCVVRRTSLEAAANYIQTFRADSSFNRFVFPIYPLAEPTRGAQHDLVSDKSVLFGSIEPALKVAGFYSIDPELDPILSSGANTIRVPLGKIRVAGEDIELAGFAKATLGTASLAGASSADSWRDVVILRVFRTMHDTLAVQPTDSGFSVFAQNPMPYSGHALKHTFDFHVVRTQLPYSTVEDYMTTVMGLTADKDEPGLYYGFLASDDDRIPADGSNQYFALPVAIVQRRNTGTYSITNQNGSVGRPDGWTDTTIVAPHEIQDCRHLIVRSPQQLQDITNRSMELLTEGRLNTQFVRHPFAGAEIYGTKHLIAARIVAGSGGLSVAGTEELGTSDSMKGIFSAASENWPVSYRFTRNVSIANDWVTWDLTGPNPNLMVKIPLNGHCLVAGPAPLDLEIRPRWTTAPWADFTPSAPNHQSADDLYNPALMCISAMGPGTALQTYVSPGSVIVMCEPGILPLVSPFANWEVSTDDGCPIPSPIEMRKKPTGAVLANYLEPTAGPGTSEMVASHWVHYPHANYLDSIFITRYGANRGLSVVPEVGWYAVATTGGIDRKLSIGAPRLEYSVVAPGGTDTFVINQAALLAACPAMYGATSVEVIVPEKLAFIDNVGLVNVTNFTIDDGARLNCTVTLSSVPAIGATVRITLVIQPYNASGDWTEFVMINPYNRSVSGLFSFALKNVGIAKAGVPNAKRLIVVPDAATPNAVYFPLSDVGIEPFASVHDYINADETVPSLKTSVNNILSLDCYLLEHRIAGSGTQWSMSNAEPATAVFGAGAVTFAAHNLYSGFVDINFQAAIQPPGASPADDVELQVMAIRHVPFPLNTSVNIYYTGAPYNGRVNPGAAIAAPATDVVVQEVKERVHGRVEAVSKVYTTTAGGGFQLYPTNVQPYTDGTIAGTMWSSIHDRGVLYRGNNRFLPSLVHQQTAMRAFNEVRADQSLSFGLRVPRVHNVVARLPFCGPELFVFDDSFYSYQELSQVPVGYLTASYKGSAGLVLRHEANSTNDEGLTPLKVGDVYAYPGGWTNADIIDLENNTFIVEATSRGITPGYRLTLPIPLKGEPWNPSWLVPSHPVDPTVSVILYANSLANISDNLAKPHHVEANGVGYLLSNFMRYFGTLVNPIWGSAYSGRLQLMVGTNSTNYGTSQVSYYYYNKSVTVRGPGHGAGGTFDVFTPFGRPIVPAFIKLT
jgi:hypothetical protein